MKYRYCIQVVWFWTYLLFITELISEDRYKHDSSPVGYTAKYNLKFFDAPNLKITSEVAKFKPDIIHASSPGIMVITSY
jgi:hypothetical protein